MSERVTSAASYGASAVAVGAGGLSFNEWIALAGLLLALLTFLVNWVYQHRSYELRKRKYQTYVRTEDSKGDSPASPDG